MSEPLVRLLAFGGVFLALALWELAAPRRRPQASRRERWPANLGILALDTLLLRLLFPLAAVGAALWAADRGWGLFNALSAPAWLAIPLSVLALDLIIYAQHRAFHALPWLWRLHRVHHTDLDLDVSSAGRFHPLEMVVSMLVKIAAVVLLGAPALAVLVFEVLLNASAQFSHANIALPAWLDRPLRRLIVTPDMHRVHHSVHRDETDSNFAFLISAWDRMFGSYRDQPCEGHADMPLGLEDRRSREELGLVRLLTGPFRTP